MTTQDITLILVTLLAPLIVVGIWITMRGGFHDPSRNAWLIIAVLSPGVLLAIWIVVSLWLSPG
jgi:uncharacterized membrane protein YqaE (UPF0057 family)